ncbi:GNAT family N-acetyltransferase [Dickeya zeae]|uniref:GNAT family N-acetyltransferase n=1 Tax=Dickeya zeae TaxID=204042 RepID=A0ABX8VYH0_9GAMM|nr:GNAT family protein [Dickeya zeae]MCO7261931.1 GNAT family N-acetyltransferase [Dickeya zeae]QYM91175.1 GNAT family N-acetyltransferase [Dickeya zeae]
MTPTLQGSLVTLRPLLHIDAKSLVDAAADGELWSLPFTVVPSADTVDAYINKALKGQAEGTVMPFAIILTSDQSVIGSTRFWKVDRQNRKLEIGHTWYSRSWQRTAANTESKLLLLRYAFEQLQCVRVQFTTDVLNERSQAAILRIGAVQEGIVRNERIMPSGRKRNSVRYSIIDDEWPEVRANLERRLSSRGDKK